MKQVVETVFRGKDQISSQYNRMGKGADKFANRTDRAFRKATKSAQGFQSVTSSILKASAVQKSIAMLGEGVQSVTKDFIGFDDALFSASAKFSDVDMSTQQGLKTFKALGDAARKTGAATQFNATQSAQALNFLALAGFNAGQAMKALPGLADFATAAEMDDLGRAVDIASDSLGAFGMATKDATKLQENLTRISDVFAKTQATSNTTVEALFEAVAKGAPTIQATGQSLTTFAALSGIMANSSLKAGEAGTQLRNVMLRLAHPSKEAGRTLRALGVQVRDENNNFRDMVDIIGDFEKGLDGLGNAQKAQALSIIFGQRAITGMSILLQSGTKGLKDYRQSIDDSTGASERMASIMRQSLGNRIKSLQSAATELGFKFLDAFKKNGVGSIDSITEAIRNFDPMAMIQGIKEVATVIGDVLTVTRSLLVIMSPLIAATLTYKTVVMATAAAQKAMGAAVFVYQLLTNSLKLTLAAQTALNIAMSLNPIGLILAAVVALGGALYLLYNKWDVVKKAMVDGAMAVWNIIKKIGGVIASIATGSWVGSAIDMLAGGESKKENGNESLTQTSQGFTPPNRVEAKAASQNFQGVMRFENMPSNASFESKSKGAPLISIEGLGAN